MWNDEFELPDGSYSVPDIPQVSKNTKYYPLILLFKFNGFVFKIQDGHKLELQTSETMKLFGNTKKLIDRKIETVPTLGVLEVFLE